MADDTHEQKHDDRSAVLGKTQSASEHNPTNKRTLATLLNEMASNIDDCTSPFSNLDHPEDNDESSDDNEWIFGCTYDTVAANGVNQNAWPRTRSRTARANRSTELYLIKSPDGIHNYTMKNVGDYVPSVDPDLHPLRLFKVRKSNLDLNNFTINAQNIHALTVNDLESMSEKDINLLPVLHGKIGIMESGSMVVQPFNLTDPSKPGIQRWLPHKKVKLRIAGIHNNLELHTLAVGDEVSFTLAIDGTGNAFAARIGKATMLEPDNSIRHSNIFLTPRRFYCNLMDKMVDTRSTLSSAEFDTFYSDDITKAICAANGNKGWINFIPSPLESQFFIKAELAEEQLQKNQKTTFSISDLLFITYGDVSEYLRRNSGETAPRKLRNLSMDLIYTAWRSGILALTASMLKQAKFDPDTAATWVVHYVQESAALDANAMVQTDYKRTIHHKYVAKTLVVTKTATQGRASKIGCQLACPKITFTHTQSYGSQVFVAERPQGQNILVNRHMVNANFSVHTFTDDGDHFPHKMVELGPKPPRDFRGTTKQFRILFTDKDTKVKHSLIQLSKELKDLNGNMQRKKHITIDFIANGLRLTHTDPTDGDSQSSSSNHRLHLGRYRIAEITVLTGATEAIIDEIAGGGAFIGPLQSIHETTHSFDLKSKKGIFFPKELEKLKSQYKMVQIIDRGHFRIFLKKWQKLADVPNALGLTSPSEIDSSSLSAPPSSPWAEIRLKDTMICLNTSYTTETEQDQSTIYVAGLEAVYSSIHVIDFVQTFLQTTINIVNPSESTNLTGLTVCRYLKDNSASPHSDGNLVLAISTQDPGTLASLKNGAKNIGAASNLRYTQLLKNIHRLYLVSHVYSVTCEEADEKLFTTVCAADTTTNNHSSATVFPTKTNPPHSSSPPAPNSATTGWQEAKQRNGKKRSADLPGQNNNPDTPAIVNKYQALIDDENSVSVSEEKEDPKPEPVKHGRAVDADDFDSTNCPLIRTWAAKQFLTHHDFDPSANKRTIDLLLKQVAEYVVNHSPNYHTKPSLPTWFSQGPGKDNKKPPGMGYLLVKYLIGDNTHTPGSATTASKILKEILQIPGTAPKHVKMRDTLTKAINKQNCPNRNAPSATIPTITSSAPTAPVSTVTPTRGAPTNPPTTPSPSSTESASKKAKTGSTGQDEIIANTKPQASHGATADLFSHGFTKQLPKSTTGNSPNSTALDTDQPRFAGASAAHVEMKEGSRSAQVAAVSDTETTTQDPVPRHLATADGDTEMNTDDTASLAVQPKVLHSVDSGGQV